MGLTVLDAGCGTSTVASESVAFEGLLEYESRGGVWKQRWFVLDADRVALVKCMTSSRQRSRSYGSILGGDVVIRDVQALSPRADTVSEVENTSRCNSGLLVTTPSGAQIQFRTGSIENEIQWLAAVAKLSTGFTAGVGARLATRELLADKFSLVRELGRGASGVVSLYTWQGKPFAIKKFIPVKAKGMPNRRVAPGARLESPAPLSNAGSTSSTPTIPDDIRREIALLKKASSLPYVIQLYDVILDPVRSEYYLVMEYMGGGAIAEWDGDRKCYVRSRTSKSLQLLDDATVRRYTTQLVLGVQALHCHRLCHRDIKPENVMASDDRLTCKIGDLGIARYFRLDDDTGELRDEVDVGAIELSDVNDKLSFVATTTATATAKTDSVGASNAGSINDTSSDQQRQQQRRRGMLQSTKGTYQFLPPEALSGDAFCGFKADIWAIGVTLYALAFGFLPFYSNDLVQLFERIEMDAVVFPTHGDIDVELQHLVCALLEKDPEQRITLDAVLAHPWVRRDAAMTRSLQSDVRALKRHTGALTVADHDVGSAVSVLQTRFDAASRALEHASSSVSRTAFEEGLTVDTNGGGAIATTPVQYVPRPIATAGIEQPEWLVRDTALLAAQLHYDWCAAKYVAGWHHGEVRDDAACVHPCLVPMRELPRAEQEKNERCVIETMRCVLALGCRVRPPSRKSTRLSVTSLTHEPLRTDDVTLSWEMLLLIDLLAENSHEVWADGCVTAGWRYGEHFDAAQQHHPSLQPYMALDESEKNLSRGAVESVLKSCLALGYHIECVRRQFEC